MQKPCVIVYKLNKSAKKLEKLAYLENAFSVNYHLVTNSLSMCGFSLPRKDSKSSFLEAFNYVEIIDNSEPVGLFRIDGKSLKEIDDKPVTVITCSHAVSTLRDSVMFHINEITGQTTRNVINYVLNYKDEKGAIKQSNWVLDKCEFNLVIDYTFENITLLDALYSITKDWKEEFIWSFDTSAYPWKVSLLKASQNVTCEIRRGKNLISSGFEEYYGDIANKVYALGKGEGINQLNIVNAEDLEASPVTRNAEYFVKDQSSIDKHGVIEHIYVDRSAEHKSILLMGANKELNNYKDVATVHDIKAVDLYPKTRSLVDKFICGNMCKVVDSEADINIKCRILEIIKNDLTEQLWETDLVLGFRPDDLIKDISTMNRRQSVQEVNSQGATNIYAYNFGDNADRENPIVVKFRLPDDLLYVNKCIIDWETDNFRAYEQASTSNAGQTTVSTDTTTTPSGGGSTSGSGGSNTLTSESSSTVREYSGTAGNPSYYDFADPIQWLTLTRNFWGSTPSKFDEFEVSSTNQIWHSEISGWVDVASIGGEVFDSRNQVWIRKHTHPHRHSISIPSHSHSTPNHAHSIQGHSHSISAHGHNIEYGIYKESTLAVSGLRILVDGNQIGSTTRTREGFDIIPFLSKSSDGKVNRGVHRIEIYPTPSNTGKGLCRVTGQVYIQCFIQSRGSYTVY